MRNWTIVLISCFVLLGCGKKGPLYMPEQNSIEHHQTLHSAQF
ncbi:LPS translocon maturation chaperone LptM [Thiomicrorhabdus sediminis]|uniref:Lipoprotein-attachment site-containing protein n=1 Tax=Thiomicrorhabdus sediminis TaxID=2580412 RepID=A0A4P9K708_9GAMM|nr:lipoprotein [Thiomicrorhabdus sediminis]QCU90855.1 hypothetical protein FE785_09555 [Thiomicrorhabdus sediminis]